MSNKKILLTGGLGYIGSHTAVSLLNSGYDVAIIDDLSNSHIEVKDAIQKITGKKIDVIIGDCGKAEDINRAFEECGPIYAVVHFAGFKAVGESVHKPLKYYKNNLESAIETINACFKYGCKNFIFSSSATVYGNAQRMPIVESDPLSYTQPYGETKLVIENMLCGICKAEKDFNVIMLRYFNPVGAHESGLIGEDPNGIPNNLMPYITKVAVGKLEKLTIFGSDYPTPDGTCVRDFIHITDLAEGHVRAVDKIGHLENNIEAVNLGRGKGVSVKELVDTFNEISNGACKAVYGPRREGDVPVSYADVKKANEVLGWKARLGVKDMCISAYKWELSHMEKK